MEERSILDILVDGMSDEPIILGTSEENKKKFKQRGIVPFNVNDEKRLYCLLSPMEKMEGVPENAVFVFRIDREKETIMIEEDENIVKAVFDRYNDLFLAQQREYAD